MTPIFYFDLHSPYAYLAAERVDALVAGSRWVPVFAPAIFKATGRLSWALGEDRTRHMQIIEARARSRGLPPLRWPEPWPGNSLRAMRAAVYAACVERGREFALAAFQVHFRDGCGLEDPASLRRAALAAGVSPQGVLAAIERPEIKAQLRANTHEALSRGVFGVPTIVVEGRVFWGDDQLEAARTFASAPEDVRS